MIICVSYTTGECKSCQYHCGVEVRTSGWWRTVEREEEASTASHEPVRESVKREEKLHETSDEESQEAREEVAAHPAEVVFGLAAGGKCASQRRVARAAKGPSRLTWNVKRVKPTKTKMVITNAWSTIVSL